MTSLKLVLPVTLYSSKNHTKRIRQKQQGEMRTLTVKSDRAYQNFNTLIMLLSDARRKRLWRRMTEGKEYPLHLRFMIYRPTHRLFDYLNITQNLCDAMVKADYLPDDNAKYLVPQFDEYQKDPEHPRVEITVL